MKDLPGREKEILELEFYHGSGELIFHFFAKTEEEEFNSIYEEEPLFPEEQNSPIIPTQFIYPEEEDIYLEEYRESRVYQEIRDLLFEWFVGTWMKCEGHQIGLLTGTWENNAAAIFNLNLINWDLYLKVPDPEDRVRVDYPLIRELTPFEIQARVRFKRHPLFKTSWRYFEKGDHFFEIAWYGDLLGIRKDEIQHFHTAPYQFETSPFKPSDSRRERQDKIVQLADDLINQGYYEVSRPHCEIKLHPELIEWDFGPYLIDFDPIDESLFQDFEQQSNLTLPSSYQWFISRMNGVKPIWELSHFRLGFRKWKRFQEIYNFKEALTNYRHFHSKYQLPKSCFPFAIDSDAGTLLLDTKSQNVLHFSAQEELIDLKVSFEQFIGNCTGLSEEFCPLRYHIEKENAKTLDHWFKNGGKISEIKPLGKRSLLQDTNNLEVLEVLLKNGADPNDLYLYGDIISRPQLDILLQHGLDLKTKLQQQEQLRKHLEARADFKDLLEK